jgi:hypothetical protein
MNMSKYPNWLPASRTGQLNMARNWFTILSEDGKAASWNIPGTVVINLGSLMQAAEHILGLAQNEATRTSVVNSQVKETFRTLITGMRDIKRRYFLSPPLIESDYIALGIRPRKTNPTPTGIPGGQVKLEFFLAGRHQLGIKIVYVFGSIEDKANKGYRIWFKKTAQGESYPTSPDELTESFFTKRLTDVIDFDFSDSGKMAHFAVQIENDGKKGPWGPLTSALIP